MRPRPWIMYWIVAIALTSIVAVSDRIEADCKANVCSSINCWEAAECYYDTLQACRNCASNVRNCWDTGISATNCKYVMTSNYDEYDVGSSCDFRCPQLPGGYSAERQNCATSGTWVHNYLLTVCQQ
jgi:hypothetical protein